MASFSSQSFPSEEELPLSILPYDGTVLYYCVVFSAEECAFWEKRLMEEIQWQPDQLLIYGKLITTSRKIAWYGDQAFDYQYSGTKKTAHIFPDFLMKLKIRIEQLTGHTYNSCLLNLYHSGAEGMAYHSDAEKDLVPGGAIASVTFGAARKFSFKHKTSGERIDIVLESGSLLVMKGTTQQYWLHRLPPTKKVTKPRINLTFRSIVR